MSFDYKEALKYNCIIDASAGTGKTYSIIAIFKVLVQEEFLENPERLSGVLFLTFTNKAIRELRVRLWDGIFELYEEHKDSEKGDLWLRVLSELSMVRVMTIQSFLHSCLPLLDPGVRLESLGEKEVTGASGKIEIFKKARELFLHLIQNSGFSERFTDLSPEQVQFLIMLSEFSQEESWDSLLSIPYKEPSPRRMKNLQKRIPLSYILGKYQKIYFHGSSEPTIPRFSIPLLDRVGFLEYERTLKELFAKLENSPIVSKLENLPKLNQGAKQTLLTLKQVALLPSLQQKIMRLFSLKPKTIQELKKTKAKYSEIDFTVFEEIFEILKILRSQILLYFLHYIGEDVTDVHPENYGFSGVLHWVNRLAFQSQKARSLNLPVFTHVFIDEFQDTNMLDWETLKLLFLRPSFSPRLFLVGDPKQSIYQFRGSDVNAYLKAKKEFLETGGKLYELLHNYRTIPSLMDLLNKIFSAQAFWGESYHPVASQIPNELGNVLEIVSLDKCDITSKQEIFGELAKDFGQDLLERYPFYSQKTVAFLARGRDELLILAQEFRQKGIPYLYPREENLFLSSQAKHLRLFLYTLLPSVGTADLFLSSRGPFFHISPEISLEEVADIIRPQIQRYQTFLSKKNWSSWRAQVLEYSPLKERVTKQEYEAYLQLFDQILDYTQPKTRSIEDVIEFLEQMGEHTLDRESSHLASAPPKGGVVELHTVHTAKGLEFDDVYFFTNPNPAREKEISPPYIIKTLTEKTYDIYFVLEDSPLYKEEEEKNNLEEEKNITYVALTRAKKRLVIPHHSQGKGFLSQSLSEVMKQIPSPPGLYIRLLGTDFSPLRGDIEEEGETDKKELSVRFLPHLKNPSWEMISYTSLAKGRKMVREASFWEEEGENIGRPIFLPSGRDTGIFLHTLLESLGTTQTSNDHDGNYVRSMMEKYSMSDVPIGILSQILSPKTSPSQKKYLYKEHIQDSTLRLFLSHSLSDLLPFREEWKEAESEGFFEREYKILLESLLNIKLPHQELCIKELLKQVGEKEFTIRFLVPGHKRSQYIESTLDFLFLGTQEKFYFLDWKTDTLPSYRLSFLENFTAREYIIQWKLYLLATVRFLSSFMEDFEYERDFGGFYYFYVRGFHEVGHGVYFHPAPSWEEYLAIQEEVGTWLGGDHD